MDINLKRNPITVLTIAILISIYCFTTIKYGATMDAYQGMETGAFNPIYVIVYNEYYRLLTANFLHFGLMHLFCNCYSLYNIGCLMEIILGETRFLIVMLISGLTSTLCPLFIYYINDSGMYTVTAGFSGVIFGLIGSLMALAFVYRNVFMDLFKRISQSLLLMLFVSIAVPSISLSGHVGGLIGGFIVTYIIIKLYPKHNWEYQVY